MSAKITGQVWELELPANKQLVLLALADHADHDGNNVFPSVPLIAWKTGYSERQVQRIMHLLVEDAILKVVEQARGKTIRYKIDLTACVKKTPLVISLKGCQIVTPQTSTPDKMSPDPRHSYVTSTGDIAMSPEPSFESSINHSAPPLQMVRKPNPWYDVIFEVWEYTGEMNGAMEHMLKGTSTVPAWKVGNVKVAMTPDDVRDWAAWYRAVELKGNPALNMVKDRMKISSSIGAWHEKGRPKAKKAASPLDGVRIVNGYEAAS